MRDRSTTHGGVVVCYKGCALSRNIKRVMEEEEGGSYIKRMISAYETWMPGGLRVGARGP